MRHRLEIAGWLLFLVGTVGFIASGIRARDPLSIFGGVAYLLGILAFLGAVSRRD